MKYSKLLVSLMFLIFGLNLSFAQAPNIEWQNTIGGGSFDSYGIGTQTADGGYVVVGESTSEISGDKTEANKGSGDYWVVKLDDSGGVVWDKTIGGSSWDSARSIVQTTDGGYVIAGISFSGISGDKTETSRGVLDYWIVKLDSVGAFVWDKTIGGSSSDSPNSIVQTADGGYVVGGGSGSGISGDKTEANRGDTDYWIVKLDSVGAFVWDKTIGGNARDIVYDIVQTSDGDYVISGSSVSGISGEKTEANRGSDDYWIVKLDAGGAFVWDKTIGGSSTDIARAIRQSADGGYVVGGESTSGISDDKTEANRGSYDYWVVKLDSVGAFVWDKTIGGSGSDRARSIIQTSDGDYVVGGQSGSGISGDKIHSSQGGDDFWLVKLDGTGTLIEQVPLGGDNSDAAFSIVQTTDGGYFVSGISNSGISGDKTEANLGDIDYWVIKLGPGTLPVELSYFGVEATTNGVLAKWTTESETENLGFTLDRRVEGTEAWSEIATYQTDDGLLGQGSTPSATDYEYLDALVEASTTYEYRLADVDYNNTVTYHATRTVTVISTPSTREVPDEFTVKEAYPNPFNPSTTIDYYIPLNPPSIKGDDVVGGLSIQIYDITGKLINTLIDQVQPSGWHSVLWNGKDQVGANVPAGAYLVRVKAGTEVRHSKVMLLK